MPWAERLSEHRLLANGTNLLHRWQNYCLTGASSLSDGRWCDTGAHRMLKLNRGPTAGLLIFLAALLSACNSTGSFGTNPPEIELPSSFDKYPDDEVLRVAKGQFAAGNYGYAARYFERAVEVTPNDGEAWLGLAASYDRVRRFDLADRAYSEAARYLGNRAEYYNNVGYSYMLRGDLLRARSNFLRARELDPSSVTINNNLEMLHGNIGRTGRS